MQQIFIKTIQQRKNILVGFSIGATAALMAATKEKTLFCQLILAGIDIDIETANKLALEFVYHKAEKKHHKKDMKIIRQLMSVPIVDAKLFEKRTKIISNYGGIAVHKNYTQLFFDAVFSMLTSKAYSLKDIFGTIKGMSFVQNSILPQIENLNLFQKNIDTGAPVHLGPSAQDLSIQPAHEPRSWLDRS